MVWNSEGTGGLSILEFPKARGGLDEDAARGKVWIFSGITHSLIILKLQTVTQFEWAPRPRGVNSLGSVETFTELVFTHVFNSLRYCDILDRIDFALITHNYAV